MPFSLCGGKVICNGCRSHFALESSRMDEALSNYDYQLPRELIAQRPLPRREESRMMVLHRDTHSIEHSTFAELGNFLRADDLVVLNNSRVLSARHYSDDGALEFLFLRRIAPLRWKALVKPGRRFRKGAITSINGIRAMAGETDEEGACEIELAEDADLQRIGTMPLP